MDFVLIPCMKFWLSRRFMSLYVLHTHFITFLLKKKHFVVAFYTFIPNYCLSCSCHSTKEFVSLIWKIKCLANSKSMFNNTYTTKRVTQRIQTYGNNHTLTRTFKLKIHIYPNIIINLNDTLKNIWSSRRVWHLLF